MDTDDCLYSIVWKFIYFYFSTLSEQFVTDVRVHQSILSPPVTPPGDEQASENRNLLSPNTTFSLPRVKLLRKTPSVKQLYQSLLQALRTISGSRDDFLPELTKPFFEKILREFEQKQSLQVIKVKIRDSQEFGRHFCSEVHAVDVTVKELLKISFRGSNYKLFQMF